MKAFITSIFLLVISFSSMAQAWTDLQDAPENLTFPVMVALNQDIHLIGGGAPGGATDLHLRYKTATDTWDTLAPVPYLAQQPAGSVAAGKIHYFGGGFPNSGTPLNKHYVYDPGTDSWDTAAVIPANRVIHEAATLNDKIYVMGGQPDKLRFEVYDPSGNVWTSLNNLPDQNFWYGQILNHNDTLYRFGGGGYLAPVKTAQWYNEATDLWVGLPNMPVALHALAGASIGDSIYLTGGYNLGSGGEQDKVWIFDVRNQTYSPGFDLPLPRNYHSAVSIGECIYLMGGQDITVDVSLIRHCRGDSALDHTSVDEILSAQSRIEMTYFGNAIHVRVSGSDLTSPAVALIYNVSGKQIYNGSITFNQSGVGRLNLDMTEGLPDVFVVKVMHDGQIQTGRFARSGE